MRILDRYIVRQFLLNFVILLVVFMLMLVLVDLVLELDEFLEGGDTRAKRFGGSKFWWTIVSVVDYNGPVLLLMYTLFSGLVVTAAMGFTFGNLTRNREVLGMLTGGISMYRVAAPILVVGILINLTSLPVKEFLIPMVKHKLLRTKGEVQFDTVAGESVHYSADANGNLISASELDAPNGMLKGGVRILEVDEWQRPTRLVTAEEAVWEAEGSRWALPHANASDHPLAVSDTSRLGEQIAHEKYYFATDLSPDILLTRQTAKFVQFLSLAELMSLLEMESARRFRSEIDFSMHGRFSMPLVQMLILLMAMPFFMLREAASAPLQAIKATALCTATWLAAIVLQHTGTIYLNAVAGAWLPVVFYLPVTAAVYTRMKT